MDTLYKQFAATYDCGAYGAGTYDSDQTCTTSTESGNLAGTGTDVVIGIAGGALLIIIAVVVIIRTRKNAKKANN